MSAPYEAPALTSPGHAAFHLARAAGSAPSVHNTQPWSFVDEGGDHGFELHADPGRRLPLTDPGGRQMVISCGAALFNVRVAARHLGFQPVVTPFPDLTRPDFLARVRWGAHAAVTREVTAWERAMTLRHTHRGPFGPEPLPWPFVEELRDQARAEGALLQTIDDPARLRILARAVRDAESAHRAAPGHVAEVSGEAGPARRPWRERVPYEACRTDPDRTLLSGRDYAGRRVECDNGVRRWSERSGTVVVLSTVHDTRAEWLRAGQALQRVLLCAAVHGVMAAFHTQPLEFPARRAEVQERLTGDQIPQLILRLGHTSQAWPTPRRRPAETLAAVFPREQARRPRTAEVTTAVVRAATGRA
ncbi:hypothetical protein IAG44_01470 [Streptomyces roseirectus]|uniref:Nitroreductase n=1 Tax=Streptomyces roseirectus TaxID=2768066 RepID=A0A7H0I652_9ACTN|nr:hypothetical protein [Streptomyces roseirectus]QNP68268.1 hypothetical protein IAG44_01470 [Streptomyces roseirectus]